MAKIHWLHFPSTGWVNSRERQGARLDTELEPPNRQRREPTSTRRSEWRSVVGAYRIWQANLIKDPFHRAPHAGPRRLDNPYIQQISTRRIRERQRIAACAVSRSKPTLEVDRPFLVGSGGGG